jgi:hypothetical protein
MHCRPSEVYRIADAFEAYCFDAAVIRWGTAFEAAATKAQQGATDQKTSERAVARVVRRWMAPPEPRKGETVREVSI